MLIEMTEHNLARNQAYREFPKFVAAVRRSNIITTVKNCTIAAE
jgi:hypothetical protein